MLAGGVLLDEVGLQTGGGFRLLAAELSSEVVSVGEAAVTEQGCGCADEGGKVFCLAFVATIGLDPFRRTFELRGFCSGRMPIMESVGKKKPRPRRSFTPEFKAEIVELCRRGNRSVGQVAKDFDQSPCCPSPPAAFTGCRASTPGCAGSDAA